jgi:hypothetical protein
VFILKGVKVVCFDTLLQVLILNKLAQSEWGYFEAEGDPRFEAVWKSLKRKTWDWGRTEDEAHY